MQCLWQRVAHAVSWTAPTSTELGVVAKSGLAAGLGVVGGSSDHGHIGSRAGITDGHCGRAGVRACIDAHGVAAERGGGARRPRRVGDRRRARVERGHRGRAGRGDARHRPVGAAASGAGRETDARHRPRRAHGSGLERGDRRAGAGRWSTLIGAGGRRRRLVGAAGVAAGRRTARRCGGWRPVSATCSTRWATGLQQPWSADQTEEWRRTARTVRIARRPGRRGDRQRPRGCALECT